MAEKLIILLLMFSGLCFSQKEAKPKEQKAVKERKDPKLIKAEKIKKDSTNRANKKLAKINKKLADTVYFQKYNQSIILAYAGSSKGYNVDIEQYAIKDSLKKSQLNYIAESNWVDGIEINYDKISVSFGYATRPPKDKEHKGNTSHYNFGFNIGGNQWIVEGAYRKYHGFYEKNTPKYDSAAFAQTKNYYNLPSLNSTLYKLKFLYFHNHNKFAFKSCYSSSYRQIKSAATWIITANAYYNTLNSDSTIIPYPVKNYYGDVANIRGLDVFAFSVYGGASVNLVIWKHLLINGTLLIGPEDQYRTYKYQGVGSTDLNYIYLSGDVRTSIGINRDKFFTFVSFTGDITPYHSSKLQLKSTYYSVNFTMGWRIHTKYPKFYQKLQNTKLYKLL